MCVHMSNMGLQSSYLLGFIENANAVGQRYLYDPGNKLKM